jgi:hypothetical protein
MKSFLQELAETFYREYPRKLDTLTLVFPNRRASLYFRKHLSALLDRPAFSPRLITIEDFITGLSTLKVPDKLELIHRLYKVYYHVTGEGEAAREPFDQFFFWGEMLLRDFDEVDKYMVDATHLFKDLSNQKELEATFEFLTDEHKEFLQSFWGNFDEHPSLNKEKFLTVWRLLPKVYHAFRDALRAEALAYEGMLHRDVAEGMASLKSPGQLKFVGFNALTKAEEVILAECVSRFGATVHWDMDAYYVNNVAQEAGRFFREYQEHAVLGKTFPDHVPAHFLNRTDGIAKKIKLFGAPQPIAQAKLATQVLGEALQAGMNPEDTLLVLPDEKLLLPVLHGVAGEADKLNVTMGFPLSATPMFNMMELLIELQLTRKEDHFNHRAVVALLGHPYVVAADTASSHTKRKDILFANWVQIPKSYLASTTPLHRLIFREVETESIRHEHTVPLMTYLREVITETGSLKDLPDFDKEYVFRFLTLVNQLDGVWSHDMEGVEGAPLRRNLLRAFLRLFRQVVRGQKVPFSGEPLSGLQVMGVLETRNLDFKNVFILSLNEGAFPSFSSKGSYVPFTIRKVYGLPTVEHQDAMYAYLFYRVLQRAENISLFYNSETDVLGQGEMSRYLQQLIFESGLTVDRAVMHQPVQPAPVLPITITKDKGILDRLAQLGDEGYKHKGISPSALNAYIECRLRFYFRYVARIKEPREVEEDLDARVLGDFLHKVMERFYKRLRDRKQSKEVVPADFDQYEKEVAHILDDVFREAYKLDPERPVVYEGQRLIVREMIVRFVRRIIDIDKAYAPFVLEAVEQEGMIYEVKLDHAPGSVMVGGVIDRADYKGDVLRIIDYKTGRDELDFSGIPSLFEREGKRNKAAFQTMLYALLVQKNFKALPGRLLPGLLNRKNLFDDNFTFGLRKDKEILNDIGPLLPEFEEHLKKLLDELYNPAVPFDQTTDEMVCSYCPYKAICYR